jgi:hypothetical protein
VRVAQLDHGIFRSVLVGGYELFVHMVGLVTGLWIHE